MIDLNSISASFSKGLQTQDDKLTEMLDSIDPSDPVAMLNLNMEVQTYMTTLNLEATMQKDLMDAVRQIVQKMG